MHELEWDVLSIEGEGVSFCETAYAEVPHGTLFRTRMREVGPDMRMSVGVALAFMPDPPRPTLERGDSDRSVARVRRKKKKLRSTR